MFSVKHNECVGFESRWTVKKVYYEGSTQTPLYVAKNATTETDENQEVCTQTDTPETKKRIDFDPDNLAKFLTKIYPRVKRELNESNNSKAFIGYKLQNEEYSNSRKLIQSIEVIPQNETKESVNQPKLGCFSWNCTSRTIAISLTYPHQSWCYDNGQIHIYNLNREECIPSTFSKKMNCDSCISLIKFHPQMQGILAGSSQSGEIYLWNIQKKEDEMLLMKINRTENVSCLEWMMHDHVTMDVTFLITGNLDGTLTMWRFNNSYVSANVYKRYRIKAPFMKKSVLDRTKKPQTQIDTGIGITCINFSENIPDMFIVGTEGGLVIQCSTSEPIKLKGGTEVDPLYDPVYQYYQQHDGCLISIEFCKNRKDVFMTSGLDNRIKVYVLNQEEPARVIFYEGFPNPFYWVPNVKNLIFGYGSQGNINVYDVISAEIIRETDELTNRITNYSASCQINPIRPNIVAVGIESGILEIWSIPWSTLSEKSLRTH